MKLFKWIITTLKAKSILKLNSRWGLRHQDRRTGDRRTVFLQSLPPPLWLGSTLPPPTPTPGYCGFLSIIPPTWG